MSITIKTGKTYALNGVTYTATSDAVLNTDDDGKISGIASGSVVATLTDKDSSPQITFDGSTPFDFSCAYYSSATGADTIQVKAYNTTVNYAGGQITYQADGISGAGDVAISGAFKGLLPFDVAINIPDAGMKVTFDENNITTLSASEKVDATLTFSKDLTRLLVNVQPLLGAILQVDEDTANKVYSLLYKVISSPTTMQLKGDFSWNKDGKKLNITDGSNIAFNLIDYDLNLAAEGGTVDGLSFFAQLTGDVALGAKFSPSTDENAGLHFTAAKNGSQIYDGTINVTAGSVNFDIINAAISTEENSAFTISQGDYSAKLVLSNATSLTYSADSEGVLYFNSGDGNGTLDLTLSTDDGEIISSSIEAKGSFSLDTENKIVGVMKGTTTTISMNDYVFTISPDADSSADIAFKDDGVSLTPRDGNGKFNLVLKKDDTTLFDGSLKLSGGTVSINPTTEKFSFTEGSEVSITLNGSNPQQYDFKVTGGDASIKVEAESGGKFIITPDTGDGSLDFTVGKIGTTAAFSLQSGEGSLNAASSQNTTTVLIGNISISNGSIIFDNMGQAVGLTAGTTVDITLGNYVIAITTTEEAQVGLGILSDGSVVIAPQEDGRAFDISIARDNVTIFSNTVNLSKGAVIFNPTTQAMTLTNGTTASLAFNNYELTLTASGDATSTFSLAEGEISITPTVGDGTLDITLTGTSSGSLSANIEVLSGSFNLGQNGALTVTKGTELKIDFGNDYIVNFKATDDAGGAIALSEDGITFAPGSDDGGLELSITRDGETRTASLDVTGSVTYKLDGSISLTKGTVVKNVFADGNILTITANTDASGSIYFNPQTGLTITPTTPDALNVALTTGDIEVVNITSIDGTINYKSGVVTASDGTKAHIKYYFDWESELSTTGGTASIQFTDDRTIYTANEGSTFTVDYLDGTTTEIQKGSYADIYGETIENYTELVSEGTILRNNDGEVVFTLETAGNYTINGMAVTTTQDNVKVQLANYDTITFAADAPITVSAVEGGDDVSFEVDESSGTITATTSTGGGSGGIDYDFDDEETVTITGGGNSSIDLSDSDYDVAYIGEDALGTKNITLGGDNTVVVEDSGAKVNIIASKGNDTIISNSEKVFVSLRGGNTEIYAPSGKMTVAGYTPAKGSGFRTDYEDILTAIAGGEIFFEDGKLTIGAAVITDTDANNIVNIYDADGDLQKIGNVMPDSSSNFSKEKSNMILAADENGTLTGGSGNDTIFAFEGSHVDGGAGRNYIAMDARAESGKGVEVVLSNGKNTVANFKSGFDYESDRLFVGVNDTVDCKFDGTDLKVKVNNVTRGVVTDIADGTPFVNFLMADANSTSKVVAIQKGEVVTVEDEVADLYVGNKSGVDFSNYDETLAINLGAEGTSVGGGEVLFSGINQITVGGGLNTLIGSARNETLTGNSDGITEFGFGAGGGRDFISNFNFDEDKINVSDAVTGVRIIGEGNVRLQVGDGSDFLTIENAQGEHFNINDFVAKVDSNIDFDDTANYFVATGRNATLTVGDDVEGDAIIWLDNPDRNGSVFKGDIRTLDASNATVKTELAGNDLDNVILAGEGDASLWGGNGGDDLLVGGAGENIFFYTNGNDVISNVNDGDKIILSGIALEQITGADFTDSAVAVKFSDGGTLTVNEAGKAVDFVVGEQTFVVNDEHSGFTTK